MSGASRLFLARGRGYPASGAFLFTLPLDRTFGTAASRAIRDMRGLGGGCLAMQYEDDAWIEWVAAEVGAVDGQSTRQCVPDLQAHA